MKAENIDQYYNKVTYQQSPFTIHVRKKTTDSELDATSGVNIKNKENNL